MTRAVPPFSNSEELSRDAGHRHQEGLPKREAGAPGERGCPDAGPFPQPLKVPFSHPPPRGRFSVVKKCDQKGTKRAVATKFVNKKLMKRDQVTHELGILQNLQHPLLVGLLDTFETPTSYVLVLEM